MSREREPRMQVWVDSNLCSGCGHCVDIAPTVFTHVDGISHVMQQGETFEPMQPAEVPVDMHEAALAAAKACPGEIIWVEDESCI